MTRGDGGVELTRPVTVIVKYVDVLLLRTQKDPLVLADVFGRANVENALFVML